MFCGQLFDHYSKHLYTYQYISFLLILKTVYKEIKQNCKMIWGHICYQKLHISDPRNSPSVTDEIVGIPEGKKILDFTNNIILVM